MITKRFLYSLLFVVLFSTQLKAQMFSVDSNNKSEDTSIGIIEYSTLYLSVINSDFSFQGLNQPGFIPLGFEGNIFAVGFENEYTLIELSLGSNLTGISNSSEYFGVHFKNMRPLFRLGSQKTNIQLPIGVAFDYTRASDTRSTISANNLNQSGLMGGTGLKFTTQTNTIYLSLAGEFFYGFSFADGSAFRGNTTRINVPLRLMFQNLIANKDLVLGATYLFKSINVTNDPIERFDYDLSGIQVMIGLNF